MGKAAAFAFGLIVLTASGAAADGGPGPRKPAASCELAVHVQNYAQVSVAILAAAETKASTVFAAAGIPTLWLHDASEPADQHCQTAVQLLLLSLSMSEHKIVGDSVGANVLGQAVPPSRRVYVYWFRVEALARFRERVAAELLGNVIAHEVGHVLLPNPGHSLGGIMSAKLDPLNLQRQFTPPQAEAIRARLAAAAP